MELSRAEMATLVDMLLLALWSMESSIQDEVDAQTDLQRFSSLAEKVFATARRRGDVAGLSYDSQQQIHIPSPEYEETSFALRCYDTLRNSVFWEELARRLAERDLSEQGGGNGGPGDDERRIAQMEKQYWEKFMKDGVERLRLLEPFPHG